MIFEFLKNRKIKKYITKEIENSLTLFAISIYLDKEIKDSELATAYQIIYNILDTKYPKLDKNIEHDLADYCLEIVKEKLLSFKNDETIFEFEKLKIVNTIKNQKEKILCVEKIIKADNEISIEESIFLKKITREKL